MATRGTVQDLALGAVFQRPPLPHSLRRALSVAWAPYLALAGLLIPSLVWVAFDAHVWPWDQAWYGQVSVELFYTLVRNPNGWLSAMLHAFAIKAPGIAWIGQWFVPLGFLVGTDRALLFSVLIIQFLSLSIIYAALTDLSGTPHGAAFAATLFVASTPLFIGLSHQYFVEPMQALSVALSLLLVARARTWHPATLLLGLMAIVAFGLLAKVTSPLYCAGPAAIVVFYALKRSPQSEPRRPPTAYRLLGLGVCAVALGAGAAAWYVLNVRSVTEFAGMAAADELYGVHDVFFIKAAYWLGALRTSFVYPQLIPAAFALLLAGLVWRAWHGPRSLMLLDTCAVIALGEVAAVVASLSLNNNQENRYLLPLAPYIAILIFWSLVQLRRVWLSLTIVGLSLLQATEVNAQALGGMPVTGEISSWVTPVSDDGTRTAVIDALVDTMCNPASANRYSIVGVDEIWFNANTMAYESAKRHEPDGLRCYYTSLGYTEANLDRAWNRIVSLKTVYFVTLDARAQLTSPQALNQVSSAMLRRVEESGSFDPVALPQYPEVKLFAVNESAVAR